MSAGKKIGRVLPLLFGLISLVYLAAVRFDWILSENPEPPEEMGEVSASADCDLTFSSSPRGTAVRRNFTRGEKIYARVSLRGIPSGDHALSFHWINPRGEIQEIYNKPFLSRRGRYNCWSWLELKGEDWFPVSIGPFGPARFRGQWRMRVLLDEKFLDESEFIVE